MNSPAPLVRYRFGSTRVQSDGPIPGYDQCRRPASADSGPGPIVTVRHDSGPPEQGPRWARSITARGVFEISAGAGGGYVLTATGLAPVTVEPGPVAAGPVVRWHLGAAGPTADDADFLVGAVLPRVLLTEPDTALLHAATLVTSAGAVLLTGPSGSGKSTLSTALHRHLGWPLLGDDTALVHLADGVPVVRSCAPDVRLWRDSGDLLALAGGIPLQRYGSKSRYPLSTGRPDEARVAAVVRIVAPAHQPTSVDPAVDRARAAGAGPAITILHPAEGVTVLRNNLIRLRPGDLTAAADEFAALTSWTARITLAALTYPHTPQALPSVLATLSQFAATLPHRKDPADAHQEKPDDGALSTHRRHPDAGGA